MHEHKNIYWLDYLRVIATFAVILLHVSGINISNNAIVGEYAWQVGNAINSSVRWAVPIFIMISGALMLGKEIDLTHFLKKRMNRLIPPFLFWSAIYLLYAFYFDNAFVNLPIGERAQQFYKVFCERASFHLWYVYFFIGLTLFSPIINRWIMHAPEKEIKYFLVIWFVSLLFLQPYISAWVPQIDLSFFASFIGYYVLGYYLYHLEVVKTIKVKILLVSTLTLLIVFSIFITHHLSLAAGVFTETFNHYISWNVILVSTCLFLLFKNIFLNNNPINRIVRIISQHSYGIYLIHVLILSIINSWVEPFYIPNPVSSIVLSSISCFLFSFLLIYLLNKAPFIKKIIG